MLPSYGDGPVPAALLTSVRVIGSGRSGCVWLVDGEGRRHAALWPAGYSAGFDPVRVLDAKGRPVWGDGHVQDIGGGFSRVGVERIPARCRVGDVAWWVAPLDASPEPTGEPGPR